MKDEKISESGVIGEDGRLRLPMDRIKEFCSQNKGKRVVVYMYADVPGSSKMQQSYYYRYVVPSIVGALYDQGEIKSEKMVDKWLMEEYPGDKMIRDTESPDAMCTEARQLTQPQMSCFLEWLKQFAAENLSVYVEDPKSM